MRPAPSSKSLGQKALAKEPSAFSGRRAGLLARSFDDPSRGLPGLPWAQWPERPFASPFWRVDLTAHSGGTAPDSHRIP